MTIREAIAWLQNTFCDEITAALQGTPFTIDLLSAVAYQETGYIWKPLVEKGLTKEQVLRLCVGDTLDADRGRSAFPRTKTHLVAHPRGAEMFRIARRALEEMAREVPGYRGAVRNPNKFCHGFGIFQYDLQFFRDDPDFFLNERWTEMKACVAVVVKELFEAMKRLRWRNKVTLTPEEEVIVAIAYNRGSYDPAKGLRQGHRNDEGKYYGELVFAYLQIARSIPDPTGTAPGGGPGMNVVREEPFVAIRPKIVSVPYPGHLIVRDSPDTASVRIVQERLAQLGYTETDERGRTRPLSVDGIFSQATEDAVELFQVRHTNAHGAPLEVDGKVGAETWAALFGHRSVHATDRTRPDDTGNKGLLDEVLDVASEEVGVTEDPPGSNRGRRVQEYQRSVGISPGEPWCVAFVYWCFAKAATRREVKNPMARNCRTGGVLDLWNRAREAGVPTVTAAEALNDPSKVTPGMIFIISTGGGKGHTGFVSRVLGNRLETIEGNTNDGGSREGIGVFRRTGRKISNINRGFIRF